MPLDHLTLLKSSRRSPLSLTIDGFMLSREAMRCSAKTLTGTARFWNSGNAVTEITLREQGMLFCTIAVGPAPRLPVTQRQSLSPNWTVHQQGSVVQYGQKSRRGVVSTRRQAQVIPAPWQG